jgi:hypothetical protein
MRQIRVAVICPRHECFLDRARRNPTDQIPNRSSLVIRTGHATATERLLADHRSRGLVIDVEVSGGIPEAERSDLYNLAIRRKRRSLSDRMI